MTEIERLRAELNAAQSRLAELEASLIHIIKTCGQSRTETRRLRWIAQRAQWALDGKEYEDSTFDLPKDATGSNEKLAREVKELRARLAELEKQEPVAWAVFSDNGNVICWSQRRDHVSLITLESDGRKVVPLYAAPVAQAGQLHELDKQCRDDVARALGLTPHGDGYAWSALLADIKTAAKVAQAGQVPDNVRRAMQQLVYYSEGSKSAQIAVDSRTVGDWLAAAPQPVKGE